MPSTTSPAPARRSSRRTAVTPSRYRQPPSPEPERAASKTPSRAGNSRTPSRSRRSASVGTKKDAETPSRTGLSTTPFRAAASAAPSRRRRLSVAGDSPSPETPRRKRQASIGSADTPARRRLPSEDASPPASPTRGRESAPSRSRRARSASASRRQRVCRSTSPPLTRKAPSTAASPSKPRRLPPPPIQYDPVDGSPSPVSSPPSGTPAATFKPAHFLRCHSSRGDPADVHTEVWDCKFLPGGGVDVVGDVVATCGGNSVCLLHVETGTLMKKFSHPDITEKLGALAWSRLLLSADSSRRLAILAVGGLNHVYLIHPDYLTWYATFSVSGPKCREVTALAFHPRRSRWLLVATGDGYVSLWDVGVPAPPLYDVAPRQLLRLETETPPLTLAVHEGSEMLLVGCEGGLRAWELTLDVVRGERKPRKVRYVLPAAGTGDGDEFVDSVTMLGEDHVAVKCAERGCVYVWAMEVLVPPQGAGSPLLVDLGAAPCRVLRWSDTDAGYLGLGAGARLLAAGDDRGDIWLWDWRDGGSSGGEPVNTLAWPRPRDDELARAGKVPLHRFPILVNRVCLSEGERYLVAVTHNNMVCVWKRADGEVLSDEEMEVD